MHAKYTNVLYPLASWISMFYFSFAVYIATSLGVPLIKLMWINLNMSITGLVNNHFTQLLMHILSLSIMVILAVCLLNRTAESLVKSIKPNCSWGSSTTRSSSMVKFLQSSMGELVNVRWTVVMVKSIGAANRRWLRSMVGVTSIYQGTLSDSVRELL